MPSADNNALPGGRSRWVVLAAVMLGFIMAPIDSSIVNIVLPTITDYFHTGIATAQWVPSIYLLMICSLLLTYGRLGDMLGYRKIFQIGLGSFVCTSVLCGLAPGIELLIVARALQGMAAGMLMSVSFAIITANFPPQERGRALGVNAVSIAVGLALGPTLGGIIAQNLSWRYVFFINVPIGIAALIWVQRVVPAGIRRPGLRLDWRGAVTSFLALLCLVLYATVGARLGWVSPVSLLMIVAAVLFGVLFIRTERRVPQPMMDLKMLADRVFSLASLAALVSFMAQYLMVFITPFYLVSILGFGEQPAGLVMTAAPLGILCVAPFAGALSDRIGSRALAVAGTAIGALALFLLSGVGPSTTAFDVAWRLALFGLGMGIFQSPNNSAVMGAAPHRFLGVASGFLATGRNVGMVLGITLAGVVIGIFAPFASIDAPGRFAGAQFTAFLTAIKWGYLVGGVLEIGASLASGLAVVREKDRPA